MKIGPVEIGSGHPCRVVAEVSNAHGGDLGRCLRLLDAIKAAGADLGKIQAFTVDELIALRGDGPAPAQWSHMTMRELYSRAQTPLAWLPALFEHAATIGLPLFSSVFGLESLAALEKVGCPAYKIAALDNQQTGLIQAAASRKKPVLVSGAAHCEWAYNGVVGFPGGISWAYCPPGYPTPIENIKLPDFPRSGFLGLSSHCLEPELPIAAVARGAKLIEMHVMLAEEPSDLEANISLTQYQLADMVRVIRKTEAMIA